MYERASGGYSGKTRSASVLPFANWRESLGPNVTRACILAFYSSTLYLTLSQETPPPRPSLEAWKGLNILLTILGPLIWILPRINLALGRIASNERVLSAQKIICMSNHTASGTIMSIPKTLSNAVRRPQFRNLTALPFLYDTATLRRFYGRDETERPESQNEESFTSPRHRDRVENADGDGSDFSPSYGKSSRESGALPRGRRIQHATRDPQLDSNSEPRPFPWRRHLPENEGTRPWSPRSGNAHSKSRPSYQNGANLEEHIPFEASLEQHVPFDSPNDDVKSGSKSTGPPSTVSDEERKAFERLRKLAMSKQPGAEKSASPDKTRKSNALQILDGVLKEAMSNIEAQRAEEHASTHTMDINDMRKGEFRRIASLLAAARTDVEMWSVLQKEVLQPIATLDLDNPTNERIGTAKSASAKDAIEAHDREVIMSNFPWILNNAWKTLRRNFPSSGLVLAIIPTIRHMGPSVYALGASTNLYNKAIAYSFAKLTDVDRVVDLLEEMEKEVLEPDEATLTLLDTIMKTWEEVRQGRFGEGARLTWEMDRFKRSLMRLAESRTHIKATISERERSRMAREYRAATLSEDQEAVPLMMRL